MASRGEESTFRTTLLDLVFCFGKTLGALLERCSVSATGSSSGVRARAGADDECRAFVLRCDVRLEDVLRVLVVGVA